MSNPGTISNSGKRQHIDINDGAERSHWAKTLGVTDERLRKAVRMVGTRASSVSAYLAK